MVVPHNSNFRLITINVWGVRIFSNLRYVLIVSIVWSVNTEQTYEPIKRSIGGPQPKIASLLRHKEKKINAKPQIVDIQADIQQSDQLLLLLVR